MITEIYNNKNQNLNVVEATKDIITLVPTLLRMIIYQHHNNLLMVEKLSIDCTQKMQLLKLCGCVEDMNPVARADCTEIVPRANFTAYQNEDGYFVVEHKSGTLELEYNACEGFDYKADVTPEMWTENPDAHKLKLKRQNNDLSAHIYRQYLQGKKNTDQTEAFEGTVIGYKDPTVNDGDQQREVACKSAFEKRYPDKEWVVTPVEIEEE
mmetsp:Transcript_8/g.8  ORF Transcript_8/g.8 Transcript_8/m.8 type:complete len:210 (+) Transcript_8:202-831(+)